MLEHQPRVAINRWGVGLLRNIVHLVLDVLLERAESIKRGSYSKYASIVFQNLSIRELPTVDGETKVLLRCLAGQFTVVSGLEVCKAGSVPMLNAGGDRSVLLVPDHRLSELVFDTEVWWIVDVLDLADHALDGSLDDLRNVLVLGGQVLELLEIFDGGESTGWILPNILQDEVDVDVVENGAGIVCCAIEVSAQEGVHLIDQQHPMSIDGLEVVRE